VADVGSWRGVAGLGLGGRLSYVFVIMDHVHRGYSGSMQAVSYRATGLLFKESSVSHELRASVLDTEATSLM